jgi:diacylglycerol kinase (CTP)
MQLRARNDLHLARRLWHFGGVMTMVVLYWMLSPRQAAITAICISGFMICFDSARLFSKRLNRLFTWIFRPVMRESERQKPAGSTAMMAGVTLIVLLYPKDVVILTLIFFSLADPLASYFGILYGKDKLIGNKSLQGSAAAFVACFLVALVFYSAFGLMTERLFIVCLLSGLIGAFSELVPVGKLDDNFVFPVTAATLLTGLFYVFGGL